MMPAQDLDVALASCLDLPEPDPDAALLAAALERAGLRSEVLAWDDPAADWSRARVTVLRSTWNYPLDHRGFLRWAERVDRVSRLWNPLETLRFSTHKSYLLDLESAGVPIVPTVLLRRGSARRLDDIREERGWGDVVVKPAVSAASWRTMRVTAAHAAEGARHLEALVAERDTLVQLYLPSVEDHGERALIWIDGALTHAVRKSPRFAGQDEAVSPEAVPISSTEAHLARRALDAAAGPLLYARIDVAPDPSGVPVVMELELVEPSLFFSQSSAALERFVAALARVVAEGGRRR
jgi:hypothetical protein